MQKKIQGEVCPISDSFSAPLISLPLAIPCGGLLGSFIEILIFLYPEPRHSGTERI